MKTETGEQLKQMVKEKYGQIAEQSKTTNATSCCGATGCGTIDYSVMADDYTQLDGYVADADLGLGCGLPTEFAQIKEGDPITYLEDFANFMEQAHASVDKKDTWIQNQIDEILQLTFSTLYKLKNLK